ncbi:MAG TPA: tetratricopeptide repeat protein, partial [Prosthecobacter sp.]
MRNALCLSLLIACGHQAAIGQAPPPAAPAAPAAPAGALNIQQETEALMGEALRLFQEAKYQEALSKIDQVKKNLNNKPFAQVLFVEGASYFNLNEYDKAIASLEEYLKNFGDGEYVNPVRMALGRSYINKGDPDKGITILKEVVTKSPDMKSEAGLFVAEALKKQDKTDEALAVLKSVLEGGIRSSEAI